MGIPEALGGSHWLSGFLAPVFAPSKQLIEHHHLSHATEYLLMGLVVSLTLVLIGIAYARYVSKNHVPADEGQITNGLQRTLYNKYYVDELYDALVVRPMYWVSAVFEAIIERLGIDNLVNGSGRIVVSASKAARLLQNGRIGYYIFVMVIGIVLILAVAAVRS